MLAVKFHHLRALIHRPFLCLPWLRHNNWALSELLEKNSSQISRAEKICILEAQQTARLLHDVEDVKSLMHDFPWWQMVSCLICASSILLIADSFLQDRQKSADFEQQDFRKDAMNCLKVFEALSVNSEAARKAKVMLEGLPDRKRCGDGKLASYGDLTADVTAGFVDKDMGRSTESTREPNTDGATLGSLLSTTDGTTIPWDSFQGDLFEGWLSQWPSEMSDTMHWSAQFLDPAFNLADGTIGDLDATDNILNT